MVLTDSALTCIRMLEDAGFEAYAVGGCVRDSLLGIAPQDYDFCTNALPDEISRVFAAYPQVHSGEKHGTVGIIIEKTLYEITTFRTEGGYRDARHPDWVKFVSTLREDLARRDFTVNAMAYSPRTGYVDPFGGQADLRASVLRTVGDPAERFSEDALRIARGMRFCIRYGLTPEAQTESAMFSLAKTMNKIASERIFDELCKLLPLVKAEDLLRFSPIVTVLIPELSPAVGFLQHSPHHLYDVYTHTAHAVEACPPDLTLRFAALLHDSGKPDTFLTDAQGRGHFPDHAQIGARHASAALTRLKAPTLLRTQVVQLIENHMSPLVPERKALRRRLSALGAEQTQRLLQLQRADAFSKGFSADEAVFSKTSALLQALIREDACLKITDLAVDGNDLIALGMQGKTIGSCLQFLLDRVLDEALPNEKSALLSEAKRFSKNA